SPDSSDNKIARHSSTSCEVNQCFTIHVTCDKSNDNTSCTKYNWHYEKRNSRQNDRYPSDSISDGSIIRIIKVIFEVICGYFIRKLLVSGIIQVNFWINVRV